MNHGHAVDDRLLRVEEDFEHLDLELPFGTRQ
jgi:hypothetical protein